MNPFTRRNFLKTICLGVIAIGASSYSSIVGDASGIEPGKEPFRFVQLCDTQLGRGGYERSLKAFQQAVTQINELRPDFVVLCGDLVDEFTEPSIADFNRIKAELNVPCYCVPGNHDVGNSPSVESLEKYRKAFGEDYYSFEHKGYLFVCVNTQLWRKSPVGGESEKHDAWFTKTLEAATKRKLPVFIIGHYPLYAEQVDEDDATDNLPIAKRKELLDLFDSHGVVAMLSGHTHRLVINEHKGIQLVTGVSTSRNQDGEPFGFRLWHVTDQRPYKHDSIPLEGFQKSRRKQSEDVSKRHPVVAPLQGASFLFGRRRSQGVALGYRVARFQRASQQEQAEGLPFYSLG